MIRLNNINKSFIQGKDKIAVLENINLSIYKNDVFGIIGHSGAGKSTLIRLINYLERPTKGDVFIDGQLMSAYSAAELRQVKKSMGMIFQNFNILETKTVAENIALPMVLNKIDTKSRNYRVDELLEFVELQDKKMAFPRELSGGQKQRVGIARALVNHPKILLCDEATSALDPETTKSILDLLKKINKEQQVTIVVVSHEMNVIQYLCDKIAVMEQGHIVEVGETLHLFKNPQHKITKKFVNTIINENLPSSILRNINHNLINRIFSLEFAGESAKNLVINDLILQGNIKINILFANMIEIRGNILGYMFVSLNGSDTDIKIAINYLENRDVRVKEREFSYV